MDQAVELKARFADTVRADGTWRSSSHEREHGFWLMSMMLMMMMMMMMMMLLMLMCSDLMCT